MASGDPVVTPTVLFLNTTPGGPNHIRLENDGSESLFYQLPNPITFSEPHSARLLTIITAPTVAEQMTEPILSCLASFVPNQPLDGAALPVLGTSMSLSNVYHPLYTNHLPASGRIELRRLDGAPITTAHSFLCVVIHILPSHSLHPHAPAARR